MTVVTLRPTAPAVLPPSQLGAPTLVGGATAWEILSDNDDASYVALANGDMVAMELDDITVPAGAQLVSQRVRVRASCPAGSVPLLAHVGNAGFVVGGTPTISSTTILTYTISSAFGLTEAFVDSAAFKLAVSVGTAIARAYEAYFDVVYAVQPVVVVDAPAGTISDTNSPSVTWTNDIDPDGGAQQLAQIRIFTDAVFTGGGFDPDGPNVYEDDVDGAATTYALQSPLALGTYHVGVRIWTPPGASFPSEWAFSEFTIDVDEPAVPTINATAESSAGRIRVDVTAVAGDATTEAIDIERSYDGGATWTLVERVTGTATVYDYSAPNGVVATYRARSLHNYGGLFAFSAWAQDTATWSSSSWWLKDPTDPTASLEVRLRTFGSVTRPARQGDFQPLGAAFPIVVRDTAGSARGVLTIAIDTAAERDAIEALLSALPIVLVQGPIAAGEPDRYVVFGDVTTTRKVESDQFAWRDMTLPWTEVDAP